MRLETVEKLTNDRDLAQRHFSFLSAELEVLNSKAELTAYAMHTKARDAYNAANGIELYKDPRGRRKGIID